MTEDFISTVNFHLWEPCNMRCKFCFATFKDVKHSILPKGHLSEDQSKSVVLKLADFGFRKINFAGGEPTLCKWLPLLIETAKKSGMTTSIVTNGSNLSESFLEVNKKRLDWVAISIDSLNPETNRKTGRVLRGVDPKGYDYYLSLAKKVKESGYRLKINSVINRYNFSEDMTEFIREVQPERWKILQVLPIQGQNDINVDEFQISELEYKNFIDKHQSLNRVTEIISETNIQMTGSYVMVDPAGRFFDNTTGKHNYSRPILEFGVQGALQDVNYDCNKFYERGGYYE